jgi:hypothetical protein
VSYRLGTQDLRDLVRGQLAEALRRLVGKLADEGSRQLGEPHR